MTDIDLDLVDPHEIGARLRRELRGNWVAFDPNRAHDMIDAATAVPLLGRRNWGAPLAAAAAVVAISGGVVAVAATSGPSGPSTQQPGGGAVTTRPSAPSPRSTGRSQESSVPTPSSTTVPTPSASTPPAPTPRSTGTLPSPAQPSTSVVPTRTMTAAPAPSRPAHLVPATGSASAVSPFEACPSAPPAGVRCGHAAPATP